MKLARVVAACLSLWLVPALAGASDWLPLVVGNQQAYRLHTDSMFQPKNGPHRRHFREGASVERVAARVSAPGPRGAIYRIEIRETERDLDGSGARRDRGERFLSTSSRGAFLHTSARGGSSVQMIPASPTPGARWQAGTLRLAGLAVELNGEVLGRGELTISGRTYTDVLRLRLAGTPSGTTLTERGSAEIADGRFELELWLARQVGVVQQVTRSELHLEFADGDGARTSTVATRRLEPD